MTAFLPANLPASVNTIEKLFAWSGGILYALHANTRYQESDAAPLIPIITSQDGLAADKSERQILRASIPLNTNWRTSATPLYQNALEISNVAIPVGFLP